MTSVTRALLGSALGALVLDILTKRLVESRFELHESLPLLPGVALTYVLNPGAAFSMMASWPATARLPIFFIVTAGALFAVWHTWKSLEPGDLASAVGLGLIAGGATGNLIDRIRQGEVVDFLELGVRGVYTWPVFNVADSAVFVGVGLLIFRAIRPKKSGATSSSAA